MLPRTPIIAAAVAAGGFLAAGAAAQVGPPTRYELNPRTIYFHEFCLPPCLCPYRGVEVAMEGTFLLSRVARDPLFTHYRVSEVQWVAHTPITPTRVTGSGRYRTGGELARVHEMILDLEADGRAWRVESGLVPAGPVLFPDIVIAMESEIEACQRVAVRLNASVDERDCYADCDRSTGPGTLDIFDFLCFQNAFAERRPYACDCDETPPETCDVFDFLCFQNQFAEGCRP